MRAFETLLTKISKVLERDGISVNLFKKLFKKIYSTFFPFRIHGLKIIQSNCSGKKGLEIGGPSRIFSWKGEIPIYPLVESLDGCNFSSNTMWEGKIAEGFNFKFYPKKKAGYQFICEASDLSGIPNESYDFLLASHVLEHCANPLKTLYEWMRVLKNNGMLLVILPHRDRTFDHWRDITSPHHLVWDLEHQTQEDDMTHTDEFIEKIDLSMTAYGNDRKTFEDRTRNNFEHRGVHHHVFDTALAVRMLDYTGLQILHVEISQPIHIVLVTQKKSPHDNKIWMDQLTRVNPWSDAAKE